MIEEIWDEIRIEVEQQKLTTGMVRRRIHPETHSDLFLAIERPGDIRLFLLRIPLSILPSRGMLPEAEGFSVAPITQPDDGPMHVTMMLRLSDKRYQDIFTVLVEDIITAILPAPDDQSMLNIFISRLLSWQHFLAIHGPEGLSKEAQQGLYGELWFLRHYLLKHLEPAKAINAWTGPNGTPHDFQFQHCAIEVKTASSKQLQQIKISNERQLDETHVPALYLFHLSLDISRADGESLPEMIKILREIIKDNPLVLQTFEKILLVAGYLDTHTDRYLQNYYHIREYNIFKITDDFPRIIEQDLRSGVGDVHYAISVAECKHFTFKESDFISMLCKE
jgi:hypothetical protein